MNAILLQCDQICPHCVKCTNLGQKYPTLSIMQMNLKMISKDFAENLAIPIEFVQSSVHF